MLDTAFSYDTSEDTYKLELKRDADWKTSNKRVLIILQSVDSRDLKEHELLHPKGSMTAFKNAVKYARGIVRTYSENAASGSFAVVNFNNRKHLHLAPPARKSHELEFAARVHKLVAKLKPTHILVSGDDAMQVLYPQIKNAAYRRGCIHKIEDMKVVSTIDFARLLEKQGELANLLGFWCRHLANLLLGKHPHSLAHVKAEPYYVDTIEKFDKLMAVLYKSKLIATDTEDANLSVLHNKIYTVQFTTELNPTRGYIVPLYHPKAHWGAKEQAYIHKKLAAFFSTKEHVKELITFNGMFDLRVFRRQFKIPIMWHKVWEIMYGEHNLDENRTQLASLGTKVGGLAPVYCSYDNDFYIADNTEFSKNDRGSIGTIDPRDPGFQKYAATDTVSIFHIREQQLKMAEHQPYKDGNYREAYRKHMLYQMSDTAHQLSQLRDDGSLVSLKGLKELTGPDSPVKAEIKRITDSFFARPQVVKANQELLADAGIKSKSLFGKASSAWTFSMTKGAHLKKLFFDVVGLEPVSQTKNGEVAVDKDFVNHYKDKHALVAEYGDFQKLKTVFGTYIKGWLKVMRSTQDAMTDNHLRPDYSVVDTGRLATQNPSLQNIPARGPLSKYIKMLFPAPKGMLLVRFDYSAHEVRVWSYVGGDKVLAAAFRVGQELRQQWIATPTPEIWAEIKTKGDLHIANVKRLFGKVVDKSHPLRDAVKSVVFGLLYGKSAQTLGEDTKKGDLDAIKSELREIEAQIRKLEGEA